MSTYSWIVCGLAAFDFLVVILVILLLRSHPFLDRKGRVITAIALSGFVFHAFLFFDGAFLYVQLATLAGIYMAFQVPISVFPETSFPRVVIGVDNGVMPVEQMQVTITKPIEDAINSVPGLVTVRSNTSRGSAEISSTKTLGSCVCFVRRRDSSLLKSLSSISCFSAWRDCLQAWFRED